MIIWILIGAYCFTSVYTGTGAHELMEHLLLSIPGGRYAILFTIQIVFFILGCILDPAGIIMICTPVFVPVINSLGFDPLWFGILFIMNMEMGYLTPPFGFNLFYMKAIAPPGVTMSDIYRSIVPFVALQALGLVVVIILHTLGADWGDMDNDGDLDLYTADLAHQIYWYALGHDASALYRNNGAGSGCDFTNIRPSSGMEQMSTARNDWTETTPTWGDADNDGDLDIFVSQIYMYASYFSKMYRNNGTSGGITTFTDMDNHWGDCPADPKQSPAPGAHCTRNWYNFSSAWADYDDDGDLDLAWSGSITGWPARTGTARARESASTTA